MTTVLIAEDDDPSRSVYSLAMRARGYTVLEADNGAEAVCLAGEYGPDLVLLDLIMPVLDGREAARALQEDPATAFIPRLAISTSYLDPTAVDALAAEFALVLQKPFPLRKLLTAVEGLLKEPTAQG